jgi:NAD(P)-dependent dehydrogenase (short-subunit alcohol dehydrogenase family)
VNLIDRVIIVTGGARGIGAALAVRFADEKPKGIVVSDIDGAGAEQVATRLREVGVPAVAVSADVASKADAERLVTETEDEFGAVDVLCSNAGIATGMGIHAAASVWERSWSVNVLGHVHLAQAVLPGMSRRRGGHIVITASAAGLLGLPGDAPYAVTKSATVGLAEWLAVTYQHLGIRVSALCPLGVRTELLMPGVRAGHPAARAVAELGTLLEPEAVADAVVAGLAEERFFILPHPEVGTLHAAKAADPDVWLRRQGMPQNRTPQGRGEERGW